MFVDWRITFGIFIGSFLLTPLIRHFASKRRLIDVPNARSSHELPTPRGGGVAIVVNYFVGLVIIALLHRLPFDLISALTGAGIMVAAIGFLDDHGHISARWRIIVHFIAAGWVVFSLNGFFLALNLSLYEWLFDLFWLISLVWLINLYNFMDGIDTIAGAEAVFVCVSATVFFLASGEYGMGSATALLAAAVAGFLFWNLPPARIFMGDVGSSFIGIVIGVIALAGIKGGVTSVWVWVILLGVFLVDATVTVFRRILRGRRWYSAHRSHTYQHAAREFASHGKVTAAVSLINVAWLFPWAVAAYEWPALGPLFAALAYLPLICLAFRFDAGVDDRARFTGEITLDTKEA